MTRRGWHVQRGWYPLVLQTAYPHRSLSYTHTHMPCPPHLKRNWPHFTLAANFPSQLAPHWKKWTILSSNSPWSPMKTSSPKASHGHHDTQKSMDQRFHWLKCHNAQHQFLYLWRRGIYNRADYTSKYNPAKRNQNVCPFYMEDTLPWQWHFLPDFHLHTCWSHDPFVKMQVQIPMHTSQAYALARACYYHYILHGYLFHSSTYLSSYLLTYWEIPNPISSTRDPIN